MKNRLRRPLAAYRLRRSIAGQERLAARLEASGNYDAAQSELERSWDLWNELYILRETATPWPEQKMYLAHYGHGLTLNRRA